MDTNQLMMALSAFFEDLENDVANLKDEVEDLTERLKELETPPESEKS